MMKRMMRRMENAKRAEDMDYSKIENLDQILAERAKLERRLEKQVKRLDTSFIIAKHHTRKLFSFPILLKNIALRMISIDSILSNPTIIFRLGKSIGKRLFSKK